MPLAETVKGSIWYEDNRDPTAHLPVTLMVHGAGATHLDWPAELRRLPEANAIVPDLPGHGRSPGPGRQSVGAYSADMVALLDALKITHAFIAGHSMGGAIALTMALTYPDRVAGLILVGTGAKLAVHPDILNHALTETGKAIALISEWEWAEGADEQLRRLGRKRLTETRPEVLHGDYQACHAFDVRQQLGRIRAPTLIVGGTADRMTAFKYSTYLQEHIPGSQLAAIEGGGHKMMLEQPLAVASAVQQWLSEHSIESD
jgi:pimeloyl-ACP methyl ester carboxylesterase